jgi:hypothetical protein
VLEDAPVAWQSSNQIAGTIDQDGLFTPNASNGGVTLITAAYLGQKGTTTLTVVYTRDYVEDGLPEGLPAQADAAQKVVDDAQAAPILYPADGVVVPRNLSQIEFQWGATEEHPLSILEFVSTTTHTRVFTQSDRWTPDKRQWQSIAATNSGGAFTFSVQSAAVAGEGSSLAISGPIVTPSKPITVNISRQDSTGSIYYWSQYADPSQGINYGVIRRIAYGEDKAELFYDPHDDQVQCVSCHTIAPGGDKMAVVYQVNGKGDVLGLLDLQKDGAPVEVVGADEGAASSRAAFTADGKYLIGVNFGKASLYEGATGKFLQPVDLGFDRVADPSFSPDGAEMVFVVPTQLNSDTVFWGGRIWSVPFSDGVFGEPAPVTPQLSGVNQYYPVYSPDGDWIVYDQSTGDTVGDAQCDSTMDPTAELWMVARGGGAPIRLDKLNDITMPPPPEGEPPPASSAAGRIPTVTAAGGAAGALSTASSAAARTPTGAPAEALPKPPVANSWPGWGPLPDSEILWLTFSSVRPYGSHVSSQTPQIWISAIDVEKAAAGVDPSSPPYWLPAQDPTTNNHIPQWGLY